MSTVVHIYKNFLNLSSINTINTIKYYIAPKYFSELCSRVGVCVGENDVK